MALQIRFSSRPIYLTALISTVCVLFWYLNNYQGVLSGTVSTSDFVLFITFIAIVATTIETASMRRVNQAMLDQQQKEEVFKFRPYLFLSKFILRYEKETNFLHVVTEVSNGGGTPARDIFFSPALASDNQMIRLFSLPDNQHGYLVQGHANSHIFHFKNDSIGGWLEQMSRGDGESKFVMRWFYSDYKGQRYTFSSYYRLVVEGETYDFRSVKQDDQKGETSWPSEWLDDTEVISVISDKESSMVYTRTHPKYPKSPTSSEPTPAPTAPSTTPPPQ